MTKHQTGGGFFAAGFHIISFFLLAYLLKKVMGGDLLSKTKVIIAVIGIGLFKMVPFIGGIDCLIPF